MLLHGFLVGIGDGLGFFLLRINALPIVMVMSVAKLAGLGVVILVVASILLPAIAL
ncbi:MAG: hypothetical protein P4L46_22805 [Fimbriimonas sp.]|nr:hypothetical protein [Fimbriimonas sp.]